MKRLSIICCLVFVHLFSWTAHATEIPTPRILVALYDTREESTPRNSLIHRFLEMPANHLGYDIHYHDVAAPLPALGEDVAGIIIWFNAGLEVPDAKIYLDWLNKAAAQGKKLIFIEHNGLGDRWRRQPDIVASWNRVLKHIGLRDDNSWNELTYRATVEHIDEHMLNFERRIGNNLPPISGIHIINNADTTSHLRLRYNQTDQSDTYDMVTTNPHGGYVSLGYALFNVQDKERSEITQWFINPFAFLRKSLDLGIVPIPDVTTLDGRRIFYSHIDGDGWNNITEIPEYNTKNMLSAEVIYREVLKPYSDFAFNVGLITADVEADCYGLPDSERIAREIFALPNVEPSSHTHTHPLFWGFFEDYNPMAEKPLLMHYPPKPKEKNILLSGALKSTPSAWDNVSDSTAPPSQLKRGRNDESVEDILRRYFDIPRSYACKPFSIDDEISGSIDRINALITNGEKVRLMQWSGDTSPFEEALANARKAGVYNINGGDSRFDNEYPSYAFVSPIGLKVGKERQIYSSNSNENTYTNLWTSRFFGYRYLQTTVRNTESPIRVQPFNIYFHIFSGQKRASLNAVKENLDFARKQEVIPITASQYSAIAMGFYSTQFIRLNDLQWKATNRGELQTVRFDTDDYVVDITASQGVLGQRHHQHSLYIALDPAVKDAIITLKKNNNSEKLLTQAVPYLIESSWQIKNLQNSKSLLTFAAQGHGNGVMRWRMPGAGTYKVKTLSSTQSTEIIPEKLITVAEDGLLSVTLESNAASSPLMIEISPAM